MRLLILFVTLFLVRFQAIAQPCFPFGLILETQEQIDNFPSDYPDCNELNGMVFISGDDIINLDSLSVISIFSGSLVINDNPSLTDISGLRNVLWVEDELVIDNNDLLTNLSGLSSISYIGNLFLVASNDGLLNLEGIENLSNLGGTLWMQGNQSLTSLKGLDNLDSIAESMIIGFWETNPLLSNLSALNKLKFIGRQLWISNSPSLTSLAGLDNLNYTRIIQIDFNENLLSLAGIENISSNSIDTVWIDFNESLSSCEVKSMCDLLNLENKYVRIYNNASGCDSVEEVLEACNAVFVSEDYHDKNISIYPNPAHNQISITANNNSCINEVSIFSLSGKRVIHEQRNIDRLNISQVNPGMYILEVKSENSTYRKKLLVE